MAELTTEQTAAVAALRAFVGAGSSQDGELLACLETTGELLDRYLEDVDEADPVPEQVRDRAHLLAAAEMFHQGQAPNGFLNQQFEDGTTTPVRVGSDPLRPAYPLLTRWVNPVTIA